MVPASESDATHLVLIHALRSNADAMKRIADQQDRISGKVDNVSEVIHDMDKRLAVIEANSLSSKVASIEERVSGLEEAEQRRAGAVGLWDFMLRAWPAVLGFFVLLAGLAVTGRINL